MRTIEWQEADFEFEEETQSTFGATSHSKEKMSEENDKQAEQLRKYQDPSKDIQRQEILALIQDFGALLAKNNAENIAIDLLLDDFEAFVFSSTGRTPVQHYARPQGFVDLWKGTSIIERRVRSTDVDSDKQVAWQICEYTIIYGDDNAPVVEMTCEIFTIKEKRIVKYRACFGIPAPNMNEFDRFFMPTRKDKMLAKVKEINYALAGQPDFEKVASLFHEKTEYRIWRWGDHKCFSLSKTDFCSGFKSIEDEMQIKSIIPYDVSVDTQEKFISGIYAYHLQEKSSGNKFIWLSTCIYGFDPDLNLTKISQQGELHPENDIDIPFEHYSRDVLIKKATDFSQAFDEDYKAFYNDIALYDCKFFAFTPERFPNPGYHQGLKHFDTLKSMMDYAKDWKFDSWRVADTFVDYYHESYEAVLMFGYVEALEINLSREEVIFGPSIFYFENGKLTKEVDFISTLSSIIPSPFDDKSFKAKNLT